MAKKKYTNENLEPTKLYKGCEYSIENSIEYSIEVNKILVDLEDVYDDVGAGLKYILTYGSDDPDELLDQFEGEFKHGLQRIKKLRKTFTDEQGDS
jgi:hypothetical protein